MRLVPRHVALVHPAMTRTVPVGPWWWRSGVASLAERPVWFCCPRGHINRLDGYAIGDDGVITPQVACLSECNFCDDVTLGGWAL